MNNTTTTNITECNGEEAAKLVRKFVGPVFVEMMGRSDTLLVRVIKSELCLDMTHSESSVTWVLYDHGDQLVVLFDQ